MFLPAFNSQIWSGQIGDPTKKWKSQVKSDSTDYLWSKVIPNDFSSILEIGSNYGNRLFSKAQSNPNKSFVGLDINQTAVEIGNKKARLDNLFNLKFFQCDVSKIDYKSGIHGQFDVVYSWATLIYIHPLKIKKVLKFILSSAKNKIILIEQIDDTLISWPIYLGKQINGGPNWVRNYEKIFRTILPDHISVRFEYITIPNAVWAPGGGKASALVLHLDGKDL